MKKNTEELKERVAGVFSTNRLITTLIAIVLGLLILYLISLVTWIFTPLRQFWSIVGFPIVLAGVMYYLLNPLVDRLESKFQVSRVISIIGIFILVTVLIVIGVVALIPIIRTQTVALIHSWPDYWDHSIANLNKLLDNPLINSFQKQIQTLNNDATTGITKSLTNVANNTFSSIGSIIGTVTKLFIGIITMPFILFYLLKDGHQLPGYLAKLFPNRKRNGFLQILNEINTQVSQYIRGQLIVAFFVGLMFFIGYSIIGLKFALTIGIAAGILNMIPYLGSFLAMIPSIVVGAFVSPVMLVKVLIVFVIEQTIEGRLISPLVLGSNLAIHPVTILIVLLVSGQMFGVMGVIFGIPVYAVAKVLITHLFSHFKAQNGGYLD